MAVIKSILEQAALNSESPYEQISLKMTESMQLPDNYYDAQNEKNTLINLSGVKRLHQKD